MALPGESNEEEEEEEDQPNPAEANKAADTKGKEEKK